MAGSFPGGAQGSAIFGGIGDLIGGVGSFIQGDEQKKMGNYNAAVYEQQAAAERSNQVLLAEQKKRIIKSQMGSQTANVGKSGIKMTGSPLEVALDSLTNASLDLSIDKYNSDVKAAGYQSAASRERYESTNAKKRSFLEGGLSLLSGGLKINDALNPVGA